MEYFREISGILTLVLVALIHVPLIISTVKGKLHPHPVTWFVMSLSKGISGVILLFNDAGPGAWGLMFGATCSMVVAILSFVKYRKFSRFSRNDVIFLCLALISLILWLFSQDLAVISVILLTVSSVLGFVPTFTKTWKRPRSESLYTWSLFLLLAILGMIATANWDFVNIFQRAVGAVTDVSLIFVMIFRRRRIPAKEGKKKK